MKYTTYKYIGLSFIVFILVFIILFTVFHYYRWFIYDPVKLEGQDLDDRREEFGERYLNWAVKETIKYDYEDCKSLNRSKYIKRLLKPDYRVPMCPESKVMLYDEFQKIVFIFNEDLQENCNIFTISTSSSAN